MKIRNKDKSKKDLKMNIKDKVKKMDLKWEVIGLSNELNKNYHNWLICVSSNKEYLEYSRDFGHGFGVFSGSKYFRIEASEKSGCNHIIDQKNSTMYKTVRSEKVVWGFVVKNDTENHKRGDILTNKYQKVGNVLKGDKANLRMPNSHYPNYTVCWAHNEAWK